MTAHDRAGHALKVGDKVFFAGTVESITEGEPPLRVLHVRPDWQPAGYQVVMEVHPMTVELLPDES